MLDFSRAGPPTEALAETAATASATTAPATQPLVVVYVFSPTCAKCKEASKFVDAAGARYGQRIRVQRLNVQEPEALEQVLALEDRYRAAAAPPPRIFAGARCLTGLEEISRQLDTAIAEELANKLRVLEKAPATSQPASRPTIGP